MCVAARGPGGSRWAPQKGKIEENSMKGLFTDVEIPGTGRDPGECWEGREVPPEGVGAVGSATRPWGKPSQAKKVKVLVIVQSRPTLCNSMDCSPPGSSIHRISQARILEWVAISSSRGSSWPGDQTQVSCIAGRFFTLWATREAMPSSRGSSWSRDRTCVSYVSCIGRQVL